MSDLGINQSLIEMHFWFPSLVITIWMSTNQLVSGDIIWCQLITDISWCIEPLDINWHLLMSPISPNVCRCQILSAEPMAGLEKCAVQISNLICTLLVFSVIWSLAVSCRMTRQSAARCRTTIHFLSCNEGNNLKYNKIVVLHDLLPFCYCCFAFLSCHLAFFFLFLVLFCHWQLEFLALPFWCCYFVSSSFAISKKVAEEELN